LLHQQLDTFLREAGEDRELRHVFRESPAAPNRPRDVAEMWPRMVRPLERICNMLEDGDNYFYTTGPRDERPARRR
jgi:hypothetical protein